jgi:hypothetical protein
MVMSMPPISAAYGDDEQSAYDGCPDDGRIGANKDRVEGNASDNEPGQSFVAEDRPAGGEKNP